MRTFALIITVAIFALSGCISYSYKDYSLHGIPNFQIVDENVARGGAPTTLAACRWLKSNGYDTWIYYAYEREASSKICESVGITVLRFEMPPSDARDFVQRPPLAVVKAALAALLKCRSDGRKCFEGCLHGRDRTGLMTSLYLWISGEMDKSTAWIYGAVNRGFRLLFHELSDTYEDFQP